MVQHCDFSEQTQVDTEQGKRRPDMIVRMPDGREIIVDAKTPLDAYLTAIEATDDNARAEALRNHARNVRKRVQELSSKAYWEDFEQAPDFVVLFIPGDQFLSTALESDPALLEDALQNKVVLSTPTSLVALLRAIAYGWRQEVLAENAETIRKLGREMYERLGVFADHLARVGVSLNRGVESYNKAVRSFDSRVLITARKFTDLGITGKKSVTEPEQVEQSTRQPETALESSNEQADELPH